jgi:hypothetical protein
MSCQIIVFSILSLSRFCNFSLCLKSLVFTELYDWSLCYHRFECLDGNSSRVFFFLSSFFILHCWFLKHESFWVYLFGCCLSWLLICNCTLQILVILEMIMTAGMNCYIVTCDVCNHICTFNVFGFYIQIKSLYFSEA